MTPQVSVIKCNNYEPGQVLAVARSAIDLLGGITNFIKPGSKVLVKPNILMAIEPQTAVDTHPEVVRAVLKILKEIDCKVYLGDGPSVWADQIQNLDQVYEKSGIKKIAQEEKVELVSFNKRRWRGKFPLTTWLDECEHFVSIPKFKTHGLTTLTGAIKNLFGLIPDTYKTELHRKYFDQEDFAGILVDIYEQAKPQLTVVDGIDALEGDGPATSGKIRHCGLLVAGSDGVAIDSVLTLIMGLEPFDILTTKEAVKRNLGIADINSIQILGQNLEDVIEEPFILPKTSLARKLPRPIINLARKLIRFYPKVNHDNCTRCLACIKACPARVISMNSHRIAINYSGCISCFCCQEVCPASAINVKKSVLAKLAGL